MAITINVNNLSLSHKGSGGVSTATIPDVCKTPCGPSIVPIPYPNISFSNTLAKGTKTVKVDGGNMAAIKGSEYSVSIGDEPGVCGGVKSGTFKKESTWITYSFNVKMDGKNACRLTDKKFQNHQNTVDMAGDLEMVVIVSKGADKCPTCKVSKGKTKDQNAKPYDEYFSEAEQQALEQIRIDNPGHEDMLPPKDGMYKVKSKKATKSARIKYEKNKKIQGLNGEYHHPHPIKSGGCPIHQSLVKKPDESDKEAKEKVDKIDDQIQAIVNQANTRNGA